MKPHIEGFPNTDYTHVLQFITIPFNPQQTPDNSTLMWVCRGRLQRRFALVFWGTQASFARFIYYNYYKF